MTVDFLDHIDPPVTDTKTAKPEAWCVSDRHDLFESFSDFNEWLESDEATELRIEKGIDGFPNPSKAFFAGDREAYKQAFKIYREERYSQVLSEAFIRETFDGEHWVERNRERFEQLIQCVLDKQVVPFIGAGVSVTAGFPTWAGHLRQQGRTAGLNLVRVEGLLANGQYEDVIVDIETSRGRDVFIQEIRDVFSRNGSLEDIVFRITELFSDTLITTNYDRTLESAFDTGSEREVEIMGGLNPLTEPHPDKTTIIKLHGSIERPNQCILGKNQYDAAYGIDELDLSLPIPKLLSYHYRTSSLLFIGCSLNNDRTMEVFRAVKEKMGDTDRPQHFSIEQAPATEQELIDRGTYLLSFGITPIWFEKGAYELVEAILRHLRNEVRYRRTGTVKKKEVATHIEEVVGTASSETIFDRFIKKVNSWFQ